MSPKTAGGAPAASGLIAKLRATLEMIRFEHSIFALPFALTGAMLAVRGWPTWWQVLWLIVAMVGARSAAMTFNRIADLKLDALNPRTRMRALPTGKISLRFALGFTLLSCALLVTAAHELNPLAFKLSPLALAVLIAYSYTKRFTVLSHLVLGACLGMSPIAAWIALRGEVSLSVLLLGGAVTLWTAGFDIIYACQDVEFDRRMRLHSVPARFGIGRALRIAAACHLGMVILLAALPLVYPRLGRIYLAGVGAMTLLIIYEHWLVREDDLSRVNRAFFHVNAVVSLGLLLSGSLDLWWGWP